MSDIKKKENGAMSKIYKVAVIASHPIEYQSPLWARIASCPEIDLMVYYCLDYGVSKPQDHKKLSFGVPFKWDTPLLEGYKYKFLRNYSPKPGPYLGGFINPGIFQELSRNKYDAVLVLGWMDVTFWFAFLAAKIEHIPVLLRVVNSSRYDWKIKRPRALLFLKRIYLKILFHKFISGFLSIGSWNKEMFLEYGVPAEKIFQFPYAVWNEFFMAEVEKYREKRNEIRKELGIGPKTKVIAYVARFVEEKHPEHVVQAYEELQNDESTAGRVCLLMIGDGPLKRGLEIEIKERRLNSVIFTGFKNQTELPKLYSIADVFVRSDAPIKGDWGATVNEAMACGLPVVVPDTIGSGADLVQEGKNGFVYPFGDVGALASYVKRLITDEKLLSSMKKKSEEIISNWGYDQDVQGLMEALDKISLK